MKKLQMVDLAGQYEKMQDDINNAVLGVIRSSAFINGAEVKSFQKELESYLGVKHVIPCGNGTDALQIALMALGLKPGDEVITSSFTFIATAEVIALLGLTPVFVDIDSKTFNILPEEVEKAITQRTKAILPVHLYGQCADMESIMNIALSHDLYVIEDAAQAIGAEYKFSNGSVAKAGTIGDIGCTSFFPSKNLGCYGDGGAMYTNDDDLGEKMKVIANHGSKEKYYHKVVGVNSRLDSIQAAVLRIKLRKLDEFARARNKAAAHYDKAFDGIDGLSTPYRDPKSSHVFHQYTIKTKGIQRDDLKKHLESNDIPSMIYYPLPLHLQEAFKNTRLSAAGLPVTESLYNNVLSLPIHTEMDESQLQYISGSVKEFLSVNA